MARSLVVERMFELPVAVDIRLEGKVLTVSGPLGELKRDFSHMPIGIEVKGKRVTVKSFWPRRKEKALVGTAVAHIKNMVKGATEGYVYKLRIVSSHFPITVKTQPGKVIIENFLGEKRPRAVRIIGDINVTIKGDEITVQGMNLEEVSQTAANIQTATKIRKKDPRVFLDGIFIQQRG